MSEEQQSKGPSLGELKTGEYLVHVYIEETRALRNPKGEDCTIDPLISVNCCDKTRRTKTKKDIGTGATYWGEHFFFETNFATTYEVERTKIYIKIKDHSSFGLDALIGQLEIPLSAVYYKDNHVMLHNWSALSGLTKNFQDVLGYLKFSVGVFATGDKQIELKDEPNDASNSKVIFPPQIQTKPYQISFKVFRGQQLREMDTFGTCDPTAQVSYSGIKVRTSVLKKDLNPVWNEELLLPIALPTISDTIMFQLYDWESAGSDEVMGCSSFSIKDIMAGKYNRPFWINIYGPPKDPKDKYKKIMNEVPEMATWWQGRVQIAITMKEEEKPVVETRKIQDGQLISEAQAFRTRKLDFFLHVKYIQNLPKDDEKYKLKIRWGNQEASSDREKTKGRLAVYYDTLRISQEFPCESLDSGEVPDVFVYIEDDDDKNYSYIRKPATYFHNPEVNFKDYMFNINRALSTKRDDMAGIVKMKAYVSDPTNRPPLHVGGWDQKCDSSQSGKMWNVHFNLFQGRDLLAADDNGLADPFIRVYTLGAQKFSAVCQKSLNPIFNERIEFQMAFDNVEDAPPLIITVWDYDGKSGDFMGGCIIHLKEQDLNPSEFPSPSWVDLSYGSKKGEYGKLLYNCCAYNRQELLPKSPSIEPEMTTYFLNMKVLGMRSLESTGILPVKRAFIRFDVDSLKRKQDRSFLPEKKFVATEPLNPGPNPNILTVINIKLQLPVDPEYCPAMSAAVFDNIMKGISQPLIGTFSIPLGEYVIKTREKYKRKMDAIRAMADALNLEDLIEGGEQPGDEEEVKVDQGDQPTEAKDIAINIEEEKPGKSVAGSIFKGKIKRSKTKARKLVARLKTSDIKLDEHGHIASSNDFVIVPPRSDGKKEEGEVLPGEEGLGGDNDEHEKDEFQFEEPDPNKFIELGYESKTDLTIRRHYRYFLDKPLEHSPYVSESPFVQIPIFRGSKVDDDSGFFAKLFGMSEESYKQVGTFKSMISVLTEKEHQQWENKLKTVGQVASEHNEVSDQEFLKRTDVIVRVYVIEAIGLNSKDEDSNSDPYLVVKLGKQQINDRKNRYDDEPNPQFRKCFEFMTTLPGASKLTIKVNDYDRFGADDLIGKTSIDLENRFYSKQWTNLKYKPIETRKLYHPTSKMAQGTVRLWVDIIPKEKKLPPIWSLAQKPPMEFELRAIVWDAKEVPRVDTFEDAVDIYVTGKLDDGATLKTDTHFRSTNGVGSFNWRLVFPVTFPMKSHRISFQIWDKDIVSGDDYISEVTYDFTNEAKEAFQKERAVFIKQDKEDKFWLQCSKIKMKDGQAVPENRGKIQVSLAIVPKSEAKLQPVGQGRSSPNQLPFLPPPVGRFKWSLNPIKMFEQLVGPVARKKVYLICCCLCCIMLIALITPSLISQGIFSIFE